jgi:putative flippase GtrA
MKAIYERYVSKDLDRFIRFSVVGGVWTAINIGIIWLLVDRCKLPGWFGSSIGLAVLYVGRYYSYLLLKVIAPQFWKYVYASGIFSLFMVGAMYVAVDLLHYTGLVSSIVITAMSFILKFLFFKKIKLLIGSE